MTLTETIQTAIAQTISGFLVNSSIIIAIVLGVLALVREIRKTGLEIIKNAPKWIQQYEESRLKIFRIERAKLEMGK